MDTLKQWLAENGYELAADASDTDIKAAAQKAVADGKLSLDKYADLIAPKEDKIKQLTDAVSASVIEQVKSLLADSTKGKIDEPADTVQSAEKDDDYSELKEKLATLEKSFNDKIRGSDGASAIGKLTEAMAKNEDIRVKNPLERYDDTRVAKVHEKHAFLKGKPMRHNGQAIYEPTQRRETMAAAWFKLQCCPDWLTEYDMQVVKHILATEPFLFPNAENNTSARKLTEAEQAMVLRDHQRFSKATVLAQDDSALSGGTYAVPQFFDMDMILTPMLDENIPAYCNIVDVARGASAQNFVVGNLTIGAAQAEGTASSLFTTDGFIVNHDTSFFRAWGAIQIGRNWEQDAHPGMVAEILRNYAEAHALWLNAQIVGGDGTTEPQGILNASGTTDITPSSPTTGAQVLTDWTALLFGVAKQYRYRGGVQNSIFIMTDTTYRRAREIATGVTGDTRFVFGENVESYRLLGHPVLIEEQSLGNNHGIFAQMKGYRLYRRQGPRFFQEDRGATLVRANTRLIGLDCRYGGQLDLGGYAAVVDAFAA